MKITCACLLIAASVFAAETVDVTITANDSPALVLSVPESAKVTTTKEKTVIKAKNQDLYIWHCPQAKTVDEGIAQMPNLIAHEVLEFKATTTNTITVAGAPAKHLVGRGIEADDNDPATADIVVFTTGKTVFVACVHGEGNEAGREREPMLTVLKSAKAP